MVPALASKLPSGLMHQNVVPVPPGEKTGACRTMNADVGGQSPGATVSSAMVAVPASRSGKSELIGTWRIDHSMSYVPGSGPGWAEATPVHARTIVTASGNRRIILSPPIVASGVVAVDNAPLVATRVPYLKVANAWRLRTLPWCVDADRCHISASRCIPF